MEQTNDPSSPPPPSRPRAHAEVIVETLWRSLAGSGGHRGSLGAAIIGAGQAAEALLGQATTAARTLVGGAAPGGLASLLQPLLQRVRGGAALRQDLPRLFRALLDAAGSSPGDAAPTGSSTSTDPAPLPLRQDVAGDHDADGGSAATGDLTAAIAEIGEAISDGVRQATAAGLLQPGRSADSVGWALTSLLMTLMMRAREDEDIDGLVAVAVAAMEDLLPSPGRTA